MGGRPQKTAAKKHPHKRELMRMLFVTIPSCFYSERYILLVLLAASAFADSLCCSGYDK